MDILEFNKKNIILVDNEPYIIIHYEALIAGKGARTIRCKLQHLLTNQVIERTFRSGEKFQAVKVDRKPTKFLYREGNQFIFRDNETFEQSSLSLDDLGENEKWLKEDQSCLRVIFKDRFVKIELPTSINLMVVETAPPVKGDISLNPTKKAILETGAIVNVPLFIQEGELIKVDTRTSEYLERIKE